jgi:hypothetical protein
MVTNSAVEEHRRRDWSGHSQGADLTEALHAAVRKTMQRVDAAAAAVYLLTEDGTELRAAMIAGGAPSLFTLPARMPLNSPYATARALASGTTALLPTPTPHRRSSSTPGRTRTPRLRPRSSPPAGVSVP